MSSKYGVSKCYHKLVLLIQCQTKVQIGWTQLASWRYQNKMDVVGPLHDQVTWYGINYAVTEVTQCDFQNKGKSAGTSSFGLEFEVPA